MSEPIRYTGKTEGSLLGSPHWEHPEGEWVKHADYARLKAEVESLRKEVETYYRESMNDEYDLNNQSRIINGLLRDKEKLKAEVERLTKLCQATSPDGFIHIRDINAAKEGKQS